MKKLLGALGILIAVLTLSALAQGPGRLSPDDQREFDKYYTKWVNDTRRNDRDDIAKDVGHMQEIMNRNHIPADVSFDRIASTGTQILRMTIVAGCQPMSSGNSTSITPSG